MRRIILLACLFTHASLVVAQRSVPNVHRLDPKDQETVSFLNPEYLVYTPTDDSDKKLPLLIYLHGSGGRGNDIGKIRNQAMQLWRGIEKFEKGSCIVVAPQCLRTTGAPKGTWIPEDLNVLLEHLKSTLPIDPDRIYLTGNSMGGYGTWVWAAHNPEHFAAVAPVSGGLGRAGPKDVTPDTEKWAGNLAKVPVYAVAGANDKVVPPDRSERMVAAIQKAGGKDAKLKIYPDEGHGAGRIAFSTSELYDWMFSKTRNAPK